MQKNLFMRFIANILTNRKFEDSDFYNVVSKKDDLIDNIPTLVIGWELTKTLYPEANIISWEIDDNTYWAYGNREHRQRNEETLKKFKDMAINKFIKSIRYKFINIAVDDNNIASLEFLLNNCSVNVYISNDIIYVSSSNSQLTNYTWVYGFSIRDYEYLGFNRKDLFNKIYKSRANIISTKDSLTWDIKLALANRAYVIPCLY